MSGPTSQRTSVQPHERHLNWLVNRDPFNGLLYSLCNWVVSLVFQLVVGWTNPSWKICTSQSGSFPQRGINIKNQPVFNQRISIHLHLFQWEKTLTVIHTSILYPATFVEKTTGKQNSTSLLPNTHTFNDLGSKFQNPQKTHNRFVGSTSVPYETPRWHPVKLVALADVVQHQHPVHTNRCPPRLDLTKTLAIEVISNTQQKVKEPETQCIYIYI